MSSVGVVCLCGVPWVVSPGLLFGRLRRPGFRLGCLPLQGGKGGRTACCLPFLAFVGGRRRQIMAVDNQDLLRYVFDIIYAIFYVMT